MQLTTNFFLREWLWSDQAARMGRKIIAPDLIVVNIRRQAETVMQPLRDRLCKKYGRDVSIKVTSGYRPLWLNQMVGGSKKSDHMDGRATDFECIGIPNYTVCKFIESIIEELPIDKLIYEFGDWVHISIAPAGVKPRRLIMTAIRNNKTGEVEYPAGIIKQEEN